VIVDTEGYYSLEEKYAPDLKPVESLGCVKSGDANGDHQAGPQSSSTDRKDSSQDQIPLSEKACLHATAFIWGFALGSKEWGE